MRKRTLLASATALIAFALVQVSATGETTRAGGYEYVQRDFNVPAESQSKLQVARCPRGTHVYGGGAINLFNSGVLNASFPIDTGDPGATPDDGWAVYYDNYETFPIDITMRAICGKAMPRYRRTGFVVGGGRYEGRAASCPRGTFVWGGGASNRGPYNTMYLSETSPLRGRKWASTVANVDDRSYSVVAHAICGERKPVYARASKRVPPMGGAIAEARCPSQLLHVVSAGASHGAPGRTGIISLHPDFFGRTEENAPDDQVTAEVENYVSGAHRMTAHAVCLP